MKASTRYILVLPLTLLLVACGGDVTHTTSLTDVGCTARCINRDALEHLKPYFTVKGNFFGPEMMVLSILMKMKIVQLPVNYTKRVGESSVTGNKVTAFSLGLKMIHLILFYRLKGWVNRSQYPAYHN